MAMKLPRQGKHDKLNKLFIRPDSEFNIQAELFIKLRNELEPLGFQVFGEVRMMNENKVMGRRKQRGRIDIAIFKVWKIICAIEVKNRKIAGWQRQKRIYTEMGIPKLFLCKKGEIDHTIKLVKEYLLIY